MFVPVIYHIREEGFVALPLYFSTASSYHFQESILRPHGMGESCQLLFILEGKGCLRIGGEEFPLKKGCGFFTDRNVPHEYENIEGLVSAWITFRGEGCEHLRRYIKHLPYLFCPRLDVDKFVQAIQALEGEYYSHKREGKMSAMTYGLVMDFFEDALFEARSDLERVLLYMEEHYSKPIRVSALADLCYCSVSSFCKKFKQSFGCTAFEKLVEIRLLNARAMLKSHPRESIQSIAGKCGFEDVSYFCKAYKKKFSHSPSKERDTFTKDEKKNG